MNGFPRDYYSPLRPLQIAVLLLPVNIIIANYALREAILYGPNKFDAAQRASQTFSHRSAAFLFNRLSNATCQM